MRRILLFALIINILSCTKEDGYYSPLSVNYEIIQVLDKYGNGIYFLDNRILFRNFLFYYSFNDNNWKTINAGNGLPKKGKNETLGFITGIQKEDETIYFFNNQKELWEFNIREEKWTLKKQFSYKRIISNVDFNSENKAYFITGESYQEHFLNTVDLTSFKHSETKLISDSIFHNNNYIFFNINDDNLYLIGLDSYFDNIYPVEVLYHSIYKYNNHTSDFILTKDSVIIPSGYPIQLYTFNSDNSSIYFASKSLDYSIYYEMEEDSLIIFKQALNDSVIDNTLAKVKSYEDYHFQYLIGDVMYTEVYKPNLHYCNNNIYLIRGEFVFYRYSVTENRWDSLPPVPISEMNRIPLN